MGTLFTDLKGAAKEQASIVLRLRLSAFAFLKFICVMLFHTGTDVCMLGNGSNLLVPAWEG